MTILITGASSGIGAATARELAKANANLFLGARRIDGLVNNAGVMPLAPLAACKSDEWKRMIDVNIHGVLNGMAAVLARFIRQGGGHVINVASIAAHMVVPSAAVYCATKHAVRAMTEGLRLEHEDIRATLISPGVVDTELGHEITARRWLRA